MNRIIKFRGLCIKKKKWIHGNLSLEKKGTNVIAVIFVNDNGWFVDPKTVCQFTGRLDKKKKEIYSGDIMDSSFPFRSDIPNNLQIVEWSDKDAAFYARDKKEFRLLGRLHPTWWPTNCEVIGNIHEHPELLEDK